MHEAPRNQGPEGNRLNLQTDLREALNPDKHPEFTVPIYQLRREMGNVQNTIASLEIPENKLPLGELKTRMQKLRASLDTALKAFPEN